MEDERTVSEIAALIQRYYRDKFVGDTSIKLEMKSYAEYGQSTTKEHFDTYLMHGDNILASDSADSFEEAIRCLAYRLDVL